MEKFSLQHQSAAAVIETIKPIPVLDYKPTTNKKSPNPKKSPVTSSKMSSISIGESELNDAVNEVPKNLFGGLTFVLSGVFQEMAREKVSNFITEHGGRSTSAISGKTDFLVVGFKLEDGRPIETGNKHKTAVQKNVPILSESEFE